MDEKAGQDREGDHEMNELRRKALAVMNQRNAGAVRTEIGWVWKSQIRLSDEAAQAVLDKDQADYPQEEHCSS